MELDKPLHDLVQVLDQFPGMSEFYDVIAEIVKLHALKNADYTGKSNDPLFNFMWTAGFNRCSLKAAFRHHIGNKISRLISLDENDEKANNESVEDTLKDAAVYLLLEVAARRIMKEEFFMPVIKPQAHI